MWVTIAHLSILHQPLVASTSTSSWTWRRQGACEPNLGYLDKASHSYMCTGWQGEGGLCFPGHGQQQGQGHGEGPDDVIIQPDASHEYGNILARCFLVGFIASCGRKPASRPQGARLLEPHPWIHRRSNWKLSQDPNEDMDVAREAVDYVRDTIRQLRGQKRGVVTQVRSSSSSVAPCFLCHASHQHLLGPASALDQHWCYTCGRGLNLRIWRHFTCVSAPTDGKVANISAGLAEQLLRQQRQFAEQYLKVQQPELQTWQEPLQ